MAWVLQWECGHTAAFGLRTQRPRHLTEGIAGGDPVSVHPFSCHRQIRRRVVHIASAGRDTQHAPVSPGRLSSLASKIGCVSMGCVMPESLRFLRIQATGEQGTIVPRCSPKGRKFGQVARVLWPRKTAAELAWRARVTERAAKYWISGQREPSAAAIAAIIAEMLN